MTRGLLMCVVPALAATAVAQPPPRLVELQQAISSTIAAARPAVVAIRSRRHLDAPVPTESAGAGVIVDPRGLVLTNQHVVADAEQIEVQVWRRDAPRFLARVVAADPAQDLALLAMWGRGPFPTVPLGDSESVQVGDRVVAVGTPLGLSHSASLGIVSERHRALRIGDRAYPELIQTDATINQGNSGGPLLNLRGEVVGLVTAIFAPAGASTGVAFAIPIRSLAAFVAQARPAARPGLAAFEQEPINIGQRRPHPFTGKCTECHEVRRKLTISMAQDMPHPYVGDCTTCHVVADAQVGNATPPAGAAAPRAGAAAPRAGAADGVSP
ncbi:MAG: trypsin-like peptidase domain-containing protein, partial [Deltaproteobacteria bacterium]|nr:trypsin-like peptidase domain-containing protein [Deltaproteobacteria bacterium]